MERKIAKEKLCHTETKRWRDTEGAGRRRKAEWCKYNFHISNSQERLKRKKIYHHNTTLKWAHINTQNLTLCPVPGDSLRTLITSQLLKHAVSKAGVDA